MLWTPANLDFFSAQILICCWQNISRPEILQTHRFYCWHRSLSETSSSPPNLSYFNECI